MNRLNPFHRHARGQALVEFSVLMLPLLIVFFVMAVDFGRVFFGWIALNNAARIGADTAAGFPDAWATSAGSIEAPQRNLYFRLVETDLEAINCQPDAIPTPDPGPDGIFTDGELVTVELKCDFSLITPLGSPVELLARADFPVIRNARAALPAPPPPPSLFPCPVGYATVPDLVDLTVSEARDAWEAAHFDGPLTPAPGDEDDEIVTAQETTPQSEPDQCLLKTATVAVMHSP